MRPFYFHYILNEHTDYRLYNVSDSNYYQFMRYKTQRIQYQDAILHSVHTIWFCDNE